MILRVAVNGKRTQSAIVIYKQVRFVLKRVYLYRTTHRHILLGLVDIFDQAVVFEYTIAIHQVGLNLIADQFLEGGF